jgi:hypothetical protein
MNMTAAELEATRRRLEIWEEAQPLLEEQRWRELMALTHERALQLSRAVLHHSNVTGISRDSSGLVEQQALFARSQPR